MELKKQHHYVWKHYLKPWSSNNQICCLRENDLFVTSLNNIGKKRFFYESVKLGIEEMKFLKSIIRNVIPSVSKSMNIILNLYNDIANSEDEYQIKCGVEDLHTTIENYGKRYLDKLYQEDISFFSSINQKEEFGLFLGIQYTRTNRMRQKLDMKKLNTNLNLDKLSIILPFILGEAIRKWIVEKAKLKLLINNTEKRFITGDQPVFNIQSILDNSKPTQKFELYYPISPKYAICLSKNKEGIDWLNVDDVERLNSLVKLYSLEQIYAKEITDLKNL